MTPRHAQVDPDSTRTRLRAWLAEHPGWHTSRDIAVGVGVSDPTERTAMIRELNRLTRTNTVVSYRAPNLSKRGPGTVYAANPGTAPPVPPTE